MKRVGLYVFNFRMAAASFLKMTAKKEPPHEGKVP